MVKSPCFQGRGLESLIPGWGAKIPHAVQCRGGAPSPPQKDYTIKKKKAKIICGLFFLSSRRKEKTNHCQTFFEWLCCLDNL